MKVFLEQCINVIVIEQERGGEAANHHQTWELLSIDREFRSGQLLVRTRRAAETSLGKLRLQRHQ